MKLSIEARKLERALSAAAVITSACSCALAEPADPPPAQPEPPVIGYKRGTVKSVCEGEPLAARICEATELHVRCFQLKNPGAVPVNCNVSIKATMNNLGTLHRAVYTATAHTQMNAGGGDWLCMSFDSILVNNGQDPRNWELKGIKEPEASCAPKQEAPPCTVEAMTSDACTQKKPLEQYE